MREVCKSRLFCKLLDFVINTPENVPNYVFLFYWISNTQQDKCDAHVAHFMESVPIVLVFFKLVLKLVTQLNGTIATIEKKASLDWHNN